MKNYIKKYNLETHNEFPFYIDIAKDLFNNVDFYEDIERKILYLNIETPLIIHCFDYHVGQSVNDKRIADKRLRNNLLKIIDFPSSINYIPLLRFFRFYIATTICLHLSISKWEDFKKVRLF